MSLSLRDLVEEELSQPVDPRVSAMAEAIAAKHGSASRAVLFYGSCLREKQLDGLMLDFYLIVSDYRSAYDKGWMAKANALVPPNVFPFQHEDLAAKYAVLSEADFHRETSSRMRSISVLARFAQPSRLVWACGSKARTLATDAVATAAPTLLRYAIPTLALDRDEVSVIDIWKRAFELTYEAELRAERKGRGQSIVDLDRDRFVRIGDAAMEEIAEETGIGPNGEITNVMKPEAAVRWWRRMQRKGKLLSVIRLAKASATYAGGAEYIAWKINRHAGTAIELKPWQRRHPLLAALSLLPRLLRSGAIR